MPTEPCKLCDTTLQRRRLTVRGQVQGVGFRPFACRVARASGVTGWVRNDDAGVTIEVQGSPEQLERFEHGLTRDCPPLAAIASVTCNAALVVADEIGFVIAPSVDDTAVGAIQAGVTPDAAICGDCLAELRDSTDRRHRHPLVNCTNCGPRFSIIRHVPYDRPNTTMAEFEMCDRCAAEYRDASDRRYHAQPIACHDCGPTLTLLSPAGEMIHGDPIVAAARMIARGGIVAVKGIGGFHLAARADDAVAVERLRQGKVRDSKPFALMVPSIAAAEALVHLTDAGRAALTSSAAPIVLARRRTDAAVAHNVAPGLSRLGVMLAYTPVHHLLFGAAGVSALVMTSGNRSDEPLAIGNVDAVERLGSMCDGLLLHNRDIERAVDDSVVVDMATGVVPLRRARGFVPTPLRLSRSCDAAMPDGLCVGGELKNTVAVVRRGEVIVSQHLGNVRHSAAFGAFKTAINDMERLFDARPRWIARDLHPAYLSTQHARALAREWRVPLIGVQHHHAHAAALLGEHGRADDRALIVVCDGVGYGDDGGTWGGELLLADALDAKRLARLRPLLLPGGDAAARDTRRCGMALLHAALGDAFAEHPAATALYPDRAERNMLAQLIRRNLHCVESSAAGRYFDAVAALLDVCTHNTYEGQAPMMLEALADEQPRARRLEACNHIRADAIDEIDLAPFVLDMLDKKMDGVPTAALAAAFHAALAQAWAGVVGRHARRTGVTTVGLTGGVFANERLTLDLSAQLAQEGFEVLTHHLVPPGDGGIAYGQAVVAAARLHNPAPTTDADRVHSANRKEATSCV